MSAPSPVRVHADWTKDLVDHLRTVHFALLTICAALIIVSLDSKVLPVSQALTQATQMVDLQKQWSEVQRIAISSAADASVQRNFTLISTVRQPEIPTSYTMIVVYGEADFLSYEAWKFSGADMSHPPATLSEFSRWWNALHSSTTVNLPDFRTINVLHPDALILIGDSQAMPLIASPGGVDSPALKAHIEPNLEADSFTFKGAMPVPSFMKIAPHMDKNAAKRVELWSEGKLLHKKLSEQFLQQIYPDWRGGSYKEAFRELAVVAPDLTTIDLKELPARIRDLMTKDDQVVEAFGLKIPSSEISRWGTTLLLVVQLYFWLNLHELTHRMASPDANYDVAWMGLYRSKAAGMVTWVSICILPVVAALSLAARIAAKGDAGYSKLGVSCAIALVLVSMAAGVSSGRKLRYIRREAEL